MTCSICGADPCVNSSFCRTCHDADQRKAKAPPRKLAQLRRLMGDDVSLNAARAELSNPRNRPTPKATIDAVVFAVRKRGLSALKEPATIERLERCDASAKAEINQQIEQLGK
jgi:hypothetical protein